MKKDIQEHLLVMMDEITQEIESTVSIARDGSDEEGAQRYRRRIDEVLEHVANARAHILAARVVVES